MRFNFNEADNYGAAKSNYFSLKDNGDTAMIRFLYNDINDVQGVAVHEVQDGDKKFDVECIRAYNEPVSKCPLCEAGNKQNAKIFVKVYDMDSNESKIWTRGKTFFNTLSGLCSHYNPLVSMPFEIERHGKKGDTSTTYQTYPTQMDNSRIEDFPEINAEGTCFQVKSYAELLEYVQTGSFPINNSRQNQTTVRNTREVPTGVPVRRRPTNMNSEETF